MSEARRQAVGVRRDGRLRPKEDLRYIWSFELQIIGSNSFYDENLIALMQLIQEAR